MDENEFEKLGKNQQVVYYLIVGQMFSNVMEMIEIEPEVDYTGSIRLGTVKKHSAQLGNVGFLQF